MEDSSSSTVSPFARTYTPTVEKRRRKGPILVIIVIIIALLLGGGYFFLSTRGQSDEEAQITPTESVIPTEEPTPTENLTPSPTEKPSPTTKPTPGPVTSAYNMNIQVLNGSGEVGAAGNAASFLKSKGYTNVSTDNADNYDYQGVKVMVKESRQEYLSTLISDVKEKYASAEASSSYLDTTSEADATVTVGK